MAEEKKNPSAAADQKPFTKSLVKEAETLTKFQGRVEKILTELEKTPASKKNMSEQTIPASAYGHGFSEATDFAATYEHVHGQLTKMNQMFHDNITMMGFAAIIAERGYDGLDAEQQRQMQAIQRRILEQARADKTAYESPTPEEQRPSPDGKSATDIGSEVG